MARWRPVKCLKQSTLFESKDITIPFISRHTRARTSRTLYDFCVHYCHKNAPRVERQEGNSFYRMRGMELVAGRERREMHTKFLTEN